MKSHLDIIIRAILPATTKEKETINTWFTPVEKRRIIGEIITKIQISNVKLGEEDDQLLLMYLVNNMS